MRSTYSRWSARRTKRAEQASNRFHLVLIKPSHYDDDGYVIQWLRAAIPSNTLAVLNGLALACKERRVLGDDVEIEITIIDETNSRVRPERIARRMAGGRGLVGMVGVQSNQFPRAMDLARKLRAHGVQVCIGGFHVSGCLSMLQELTPELKEAIDLGISLFAGEAEGRFDMLLRDAWNGTLKPLYNYMDDLPGLEGATLPMLPAGQIAKTTGNLTSFDSGRGCPFLCSFCTIINVQGRKSRRRSVEDVEQIIRQNVEQGVNRFFITDDNFARNTLWESIFDRLIHLREVEKMDIKFVIQVDTMCHRLPRFIEKAGRAGVVRAFIGLENINPESLAGAKKKQNKITEYRKMLLAWKKARVMTFAGYILGFPTDTPASILRDIGIIQRELPVDLLQFSCMTPLPGSEDHQKLYQAGVEMDPDLNKYDVEHVTTAHPLMSKAEWEKVYQDAWSAYYTPDHMRTVMRRASASGSSPGKVLFLMIWAHLCVKLEKVQPYQGGYLRRKHRRDRRPSLPLENPLVFYPRYAASIVYKHFKLAQSVAQHYGFARRLIRDSRAREYTDLALTPIVDDDFDSFELFTATAEGRSAAAKARKKTDPSAATPDGLVHIALKS